MQTDPEFYEVAQAAPNAFLQLITRTAPGCAYAVSSLELKRTDRRSDLVLVPGDVSREVWVVEVQGYKADDAERRLLEEAVLLATDHRLWGRLRTAIIYLTDAHRRAALPAHLNPQYAQLTDPLRIVLRGISPEELMSISPELFPLLPLTRIRRRDLLRRGADWWVQACRRVRDQARQDRMRELFLKLYAGRFPRAILEQLTRSLEDVMVDMLKTRIGQDILDIGREEGREEGAVRQQVEAIHQVLEARFGRVPASLRRQLAACEDMTRLRAVLQKAATATGLTEVEAALAG